MDFSKIFEELDEIVFSYSLFDGQFLIELWSHSIKTRIENIHHDPRT